MNAETNKQVARSFLQSADDVDFEAWRSIASPGLVASANGGDPMNREEFEGMVRGIIEGFGRRSHDRSGKVTDHHPAPPPLEAEECHRPRPRPRPRPLGHA
jgi:hypothetical protein